MQVHITARHVKISAPLRQYVIDKISRIEKYFDNLIEAHVIVGTEKYYSWAEATVVASGKRINAKEQAKDLYAAVDLLLDTLERQIKTFKEKLKTPYRLQRRRKTSTSTKEVIPIGDEENVPAITRGVFDIAPISVTEAIKKMEETNNDFFPFVNFNDRRINVVYKKKNGTYGLLEPM